MNYYEHHLGDYMRDTAHLTMVEDGAYRRLLDAYYIKEQPIPASVRDAYRLVRAQSTAERKAVEVVLGEFFEQTPEGWRHKRCDAEIGRFQEKREKAQRSANARWGASVRNANASPNEPDGGMRTHDERNATRAHAGARAPARPQSPVPNHQSLKPGPEPRAPAPPASAHEPTPGARITRAVREAGIARCNPSDPRLLALVERGATAELFVALVPDSLDKHDPWAYLLAKVDGQITDAAQLAQGPRATARPTTRADHRTATTNALTGRDRKASHDQHEPAVDVASRVVES